MFNPSREQVRQFFCEAWRKYREKSVLEGLEAIAADLILAHPEYQPLLEAPEAAMEKEWTPEQGESNPFLHLSLHLAVEEQLAIDQPPGVRAAYQHILQKLDDPHQAKHHILECLGEAVWRASRSGQMDTTAYLEAIRRVGPAASSYANQPGMPFRK